VHPDSYLPGSHLSVIKLPWERFPALAVMCDRSAPSRDQNDWSFGYTNGVYVELIVRSELFLPDDPEAEVYQQGLTDRRAKRTCQAVVDAVMSDSSLGGAVPMLGNPSVRQGDAFALQGTKLDQQGRLRIFCVSRIDFGGDVYTQFADSPTTAPSILPESFGA
jgi:hypothetical protein